MELAIAETAIYAPPIIIAALLFIYRHSILHFGSLKIVSLVSNQLILRKNQLIEVIHIGSQFVYRLKNTLQLATAKLLEGPLIVYQHILQLFQSIRLKFEIVSVQVSNFTQSVFSNISSFFHPAPKTSWDTLTLACVILGGFAITLLAWYYLQKSRVALEVLPSVEEPPVEEPVVEKKAVRRKRKAN